MLREEVSRTGSRTHLAASSEGIHPDGERHTGCMKRLLLLLPLLLLSSCGGSSIRQLDCTITSADADNFGETESFIIDTKTGDRFYIQPDKPGLIISPTPQMMNLEGKLAAEEITHESKIVNDVYLFMYKISYRDGLFQSNAAINLTSLKGEFSQLTLSRRSSSQGSCIWVEPPTTVIDQPL